MNPLLASALEIAAWGWRVFPLHHPVNVGGCSCKQAEKCQSVGKHPRIKDWQVHASTDPTRIEEWWRRWSYANVGIVTGETSGIVVLDIDPGHGGEESLEEWQRRHGRLPATCESLTGSGGRHLLFQHPGVPIANKQSWDEFPGLDIRGDGGLIVGPGSLHACGRRYEWEASSHPAEVPLAEMPGWLVERLSSPAAVPTEKRLARDEGSPLPVSPVLDGCAWVRHCIEDAKTLGEHAWYGLLTISGRMEDGARLSHAWSKPHPQYDPAQTNEKLAHALADTGPYSCAAIRRDLGGEPYCSGCIHWGKIKSPCSLGRVRELYLEVPPEEARCDFGEGGEVDWDAYPDEPLPAAIEPPPIPTSTTREAPAPSIVPPHVLEAEKALLAGVLAGITPLRLRTLLERVSPADFYSPQHDGIWEAVGELVEELQPVDLIMVEERLNRLRRLETSGGSEYLRLLQQADTRSASLETYAGLIRHKSELRGLIHMCQQIEYEARQAEAEPEPLREYLTAMLLATTPRGLQEAVNYAEVVDAELERIERGKTEPNLMFGLVELDRYTEGLGRGEVGIICGRPGTGKSIWCAMQLRHAAESWGPTLYVSLEMSGPELVRRDLAGATDYTFRQLREARLGQGRFGADDLAILRDHAQRQRAVHKRIWIDEHACTLQKLVSRIHRYRLQHQIDAVIVDYGQLVSDDTGGKRSKTEEVMKVARALKNEIAVPGKIPVWVAVQAGRGSDSRNEHPKPLGFSDLGWSGEWEAVAGRILFLNPGTGGETSAGNPIMLHVAKNRHGGCGSVPLYLNGPKFQFTSAEVHQQDHDAPDLDERRFLND